MRYRYETHLHTKEASACGISSGSEYPKFYKQLGYTGIIITDHFLNGNTAIDRSLSWEEQIHLFCLGYERAKESGDRLGVQVFFGWEHAFGGQEFLIYGLDKQWLLDNPDMIDWSPATLFDAVDRDGGVMVQAHPFRERSYISEIHLYPHYSHAVEIRNSHNRESADLLALSYAKEHNLLGIGGGDVHATEETPTHGGGVSFEEKLGSIADFIAAIKEKQSFQIINALPLDSKKPQAPSIPAFLHTLETDALPQIQTSVFK